MRNKRLFLPLVFTLVIGLLAYLGSQVLAVEITTGGSVQNSAPSFSTGPSDGSSSATTPTNAGSDVTFTAIATDTNTEQWYLAVCKYGFAKPANNAAPSCCTDGTLTTCTADEKWAISTSSVASGAQQTLTYATSAGSAESNVWYAFACDNAPTGTCSSASQGASDTGSPFIVNHRPVIGTVTIGPSFGSSSSIDPSAGTSFKVTTAVGAGADYGRGVAIQADGKVVVAGEDGADFATVRYQTNGILDTSFDTDGKVTTNFGNTDAAKSVIVQSDGKIIVGGSAYDGSKYNFALARYKSDGSLDTTFDSDGKVTTSFGSYDSEVYAVIVQSDGKIVAAGYANNGTDKDFALARYNADGSLDFAFDSDGKVTAPVGSGDDWGWGVDLQADSKIVVAGRSYNGSNWDFSLARFNTNGSIDSTFDSDGVTMTGFTGDDYATSVKVQSDGGIVVGGYSNGSGNFALARYNADGSLDTSFDFDGKVSTDFSNSNDECYSIALQSNGKIVAAGYSGNTNDFALARYNSDGSLDSSFGSGGKVNTSISSGYDVSDAVVILSDGKILAAGYSNNDFALVRYTSAGNLDTMGAGDAYVQVGVTDPDTDGSADTVGVYVCSTNSVSSGSCVASTLCSGGGYVSGTNANCVMSNQVPIPTAHGSSNVYVFVKDGHGFVDADAGDNNVIDTSRSYSVTDVAPYIVDSSAYTVDGITLTAGNYTTKNYTVTVKDDNGDTDLVDTATGYLFDDTAIDLASGTCTPDQKNCYSDSVCTLSNNTSGTDSQATATCSLDVWFNANYSSGWKLHVNPADQQGAITNQSDSSAISTNQLLGITAEEGAIAYGSLAVSATSSGVTIHVGNVGNVATDVIWQGTSMCADYPTCSTTPPLNPIARSQQKWAVGAGSDFTYDSQGHALIQSGSAGNPDDNGCADVNIPVRTTALDQSGDQHFYWKIRIPSPQAVGNYTGANTIASTAANSCTGTP